MVAVKQAVMAKDHSDTPLDCAVFYIDIRTQGKDFDRYYENAGNNGVRFIPARIHTIDALPETEDLLLRYADEHGHPQEETFDMVVLSTGLEVSRDAIQLSNTLGVELDKYHFTRSDSFHPAATSRSGIYACGAFTGPKDIPQSVMEASAAACAATENLAVARNTQIGGIVRVPEVAEYAGTLPGVVYVEENLFTCSQDTQDKMTEVIRQQGLNRVVVAACTPRTHEALFQETLINAGLNKYLIEMANIRNQDSWVHSNDPDAATAKAKDLVYMAVAKSFLSLPLQETDLPVSRSALVVGAGVAGMTTALALARQGYPVHLVEKSEVFGGNARGLNKTYRDERIGSFLEDLIRQVESEPRISVHLRATISSVDGFVGNFKSVISNGSSQKTVDHGVAVIATGAKEYKPKEYLYGEHAAVVTHLEMDELFRNDDLRIKRAGDVVFIQCVGSRNKEHPTEKSQPPDKRLYPLPGYPDIRRKRGPLPGSKKPGDSFFPIQSR
jgi:heterodisulfide reductase subunit A